MERIIDKKRITDKIVEELKLYDGPIVYSELRKKFNDPEFQESLIFLITAGDVKVIGYGYEETEYPDEVKKINKVIVQLQGPIVYSTGNIDREMVLHALGYPRKMSKYASIIDEGMDDPVLIHASLWPMLFRSNYSKEKKEIQSLYM